jgi:uncharacterized protein (DUF1330 family)
MLYLTVHLFIYPEQADAFHRFENQVLPVFKSHGGMVLLAFQPESTMAEKEMPHEIHVLSIPSEEAFFAYRNDPIVQGLKEERVRVIRKMEIFRSNEAISY